MKKNIITLTLLVAFGSLAAADDDNPWIATHVTIDGVEQSIEGLVAADRANVEIGGFIALQCRPDEDEFTDDEFAQVLRACRFVDDVEKNLIKCDMESIHPDIRLVAERGFVDVDEVAYLSEFVVNAATPIINSQKYRAHLNSMLPAVELPSYITVNWWLEHCALPEEIAAAVAASAVAGAGVVTRSQKGR